MSTPVKRNNENESGEENSLNSPGENRRSPRKRRNYVERRSSVAGSDRSGCSWKDVMCVLSVLLVIGLAGLLRLQEELFGSTEKFRLESDADADFYEILGVPHAASMKEVKKAYRDRAVELHPDHHPGCSDCQKRFISCTRAYETLIDPEKRKIYDETRGSYEPIVSDYSISLTSFNYQKLVLDSSAIWVIQVYDDLDSYSVHFANQWDSVAGSPEYIRANVKFGRVNARRDRAVLGMLPVRAKLYPTVMMFSRDSLPSLFSLADTSSKALRKWIAKEAPHHIAETSSSNRYFIGITLRKLPERGDPVIVRGLSVKYARVFDIGYLKGDECIIRLVDKKGSIPAPKLKCTQENYHEVIEQIHRRLIIPLTRYNVHDVCSSSEAGAADDAAYQVLCVSVNSIGDEANPTLLSDVVIDGNYILQRVLLPSGSAGHSPFVLDFDAGLVSSNINVNSFADVTVDDLSFQPLEQLEFIEKYLPKSYMDILVENKWGLTALAMMTASMVVFTRFTAVQITLAVMGTSTLIGALNYLSGLTVLKNVVGKLFGWN